MLLVELVIRTDIIRIRTRIKSLIHRHIFITLDEYLLVVLPKEIRII